MRILRVRPPPARRQTKVKHLRATSLLAGMVVTVVFLVTSAVLFTGTEGHSPTQEPPERGARLSPPLAPLAGVQDQRATSERSAIGSTSDTSEGQPFVCSVVKVHDGDGPVWCSEGERIRLAGIAAREIDESCRSNQPCPPASGASAQLALQQMVLGKVLSCQPVGTSYNRTVAWCRLPSSEDVSCEMIKTGTALRWDRYDPEQRLIGCSR